MTRHWYLDWDGPRPDNQVRAAVDAVLADLEAAEQLAAAAGGSASGSTAEGASPPAGPAKEQGEDDADHPKLA
jgi:hypothetical protein